jgi:pyruvate/2-oxoglutarate/acetoin dehydrogenase E1 component
MNYLDELTAAMTTLAQNPKSLFIGQSVRYDGQAPFKTLTGVPMEQRIEMPVAENMQLGISTGLAMAGYLPISIFPRMDFLILAMDALVNHLDKLPLIGPDPFRPKIIIRVAVGAKEPVYPGPQHCQDYTIVMRQMLKTVRVIELKHADDVKSGYELALNLRQSVLVVEHMSEYRR